MPTTYIADGTGAYKAAKDIYVADATGAWKKTSAVYVADATGAWKKVHPPIVAVNQTIYSASAVIDIALYLNFNITSSNMWHSGSWWGNGTGLQSYTYTGNAAFTPATLAQYSSVSIYIKSWSGRGNGWYVTQQPSAANGWVGQVLMGDDPQNGSSWYGVEIGITCTP